MLTLQLVYALFEDSGNLTFDGTTLAVPGFPLETVSVDITVGSGATTQNHWCCINSSRYFHFWWIKCWMVVLLLTLQLLKVEVHKQQSCYCVGGGECMKMYLRLNI